MTTEGKEIAIQEQSFSLSNGRMIVDMKEINLPNGIYFIRIESLMGTEFRKVLVGYE